MCDPCERVIRHPPHAKGRDSQVENHSSRPRIEFLDPLVTPATGTEVGGDSMHTCCLRVLWMEVLSARQTGVHPEAVPNTVTTLKIPSPLAFLRRPISQQLWLTPTQQHPRIHTNSHSRQRPDLGDLPEEELTPIWSVGLGDFFPLFLEPFPGRTLTSRALPPITTQLTHQSVQGCG